MPLSSSSCVNSAYDSSYAYRGSIAGDDYDDIFGQYYGDDDSSNKSSGLSQAGVIAISVCLSVFFCCSGIVYFVQKSMYDTVSAHSKVYVANEVQMVEVRQPRTDLAKVRTKGKTAKASTPVAYKV